MSKKTFAQQLGIKEGEVVVTLHAKEQFVTRMRNQLPPYARLFQTVQDDKQPTMVIRFFNEHADFDATFRWLEKRLAPGGCIWGVLPKTVKERDLKDEMVRSAKRIGLTPGKVLAFSPTEQAVRLNLKK